MRLVRFYIRVRDALCNHENIVKIFHNEYKWRKVKNLHLTVENKCQMCCQSVQLDVHHIIPWHVSENLRFKKDNLITLCRACHFKFGHFLNWRKYNVKIRELCNIAQNIYRSCNEENN